MIVVTGAAGFIGSCLIRKLNQENFKAIVAVDSFADPVRNKNLDGLLLKEKVAIMDFPRWFDTNQELVEFIFHMGAITDTSEFDTVKLNTFNTQYTKDIWLQCIRYQVPLVYASSAATYGLGELGYSDDESLIPKLKPLNPYGQSKQDVDVWALNQKEKPFFWAGLKFFNVYGPNEYHKGRMASVIFQSYNQISKTGKMTVHGRRTDARLRLCARRRRCVLLVDAPS
jgi:ADP-L-glycero-D-manno-heptose 6-epimerase